MSYELPSDWSLESLLDYCAVAVAGLEAIDELKELAAPWSALREDLRKARDTRDEDRWAVLAASAKVAVQDTVWDGCVGSLSGRAYLLAEKDADRSPYVELFGSVSAADSQSLGPAKSMVFGALLLKKLSELNHPELQSAAAALEKANSAFDAAARERTAAQEQAAVHEIRRGRLHELAETLAGTTEIGILTRFPRNKSLVKAILAPQQPKRRMPSGPPGAMAPDGSDILR